MTQSQLLVAGTVILALWLALLVALILSLNDRRKRARYTVRVIRQWRQD